MVILVFAPFLLLLLVLLVAGLVFVVVPGGFIVVLVGLYYVALAGLYSAFAWLTDLVERAGTMRMPARTPPVRQATTSSESASHPRQRPFVPRGDPIPVTVGFGNDRAVGPALNLALNRRRTGDLERIRALDVRRAADSQDRTAA